MCHTCFYRPWCRFCVMGRGLERRHLTQSGDRDDNRPRVFGDFGYLRGDSTPLLVAKVGPTAMTFAASFSMRGGGDPHAARLLAKWIDGLGCQEVTVRTGSEPSICELIRRVRELPAEGTTTVDEISDSAGNWIAERAILTVGVLVRTTKAVVEENVLEGRGAGLRLTAWTVHYAAQVICACMVGADGLTPLRQLKGASSARRWQVSVNVCGSETLFWKERTSSIRDARRRGCLDSASSRPATSW